MTIQETNLVHFNTQCLELFSSLLIYIITMREIKAHLWRIWSCLSSWLEDKEECSVHGSILHTKTQTSGRKETEIRPCKHTCTCHMDLEHLYFRLQLHNQWNCYQKSILLFFSPDFSLPFGLLVQTAPHRLLYSWTRTLCPSGWSSSTEDHSYSVRHIKTRLSNQDLHYNHTSHKHNCYVDS